MILFFLLLFFFLFFFPSFLFLCRLDSARASKLRETGSREERIGGAFAGEQRRKRKKGQIVRGVVCLCFRLHGFGYAIESSRTEPRAVV